MFVVTSAKFDRNSIETLDSTRNGRIVETKSVTHDMDFLYASAEVHTLPPRKRLGCVLREVAHSPVDLGSKKARLVGESYVKLALGDPRLAGKALDMSGGGGGNDSCDDADTRETGGSYGTSNKSKGPRRNASASSLQTTEQTAKKKKKLSTKSERSGTPGAHNDDDDDVTAKEPKELTDEEMAMKLHMEMNASPRISRGARSASGAGKPTVLFG